MPQRPIRTDQNEEELRHAIDRRNGDGSVWMDGMNGTEALLQSRFCIHCKFRAEDEDATEAKELLKEHYFAHHGYTWKEEDEYDLSWILPYWKIPKAEIPIFAFFCRTDENKKLESVEVAEATVEWNDEQEAWLTYRAALAESPYVFDSSDVPMTVNETVLTVSLESIESKRYKVLESGLGLGSLLIFLHQCTLFEGRKEIMQRENINDFKNEKVRLWTRAIAAVDDAIIEILKFSDNCWDETTHEYDIDAFTSDFRVKMKETMQRFFGIKFEELEQKSTVFGGTLEQRMLWWFRAFQALTRIEIFKERQEHINDYFKELPQFEEWSEKVEDHEESQPQEPKRTFLTLEDAQTCQRSEVRAEFAQKWHRISELEFIEFATGYIQSQEALKKSRDNARAGIQ